MELIYALVCRVKAPTKTTTSVSLECLGVKVERSAGSVQRALEESLTEFAHVLRPALLKEARTARKQEEPLPPAVEVSKDATEEQAGPPDHTPTLFPQDAGGSGSGGAPGRESAGTAGPPLSDTTILLS